MTLRKIARKIGVRAERVLDWEGSGVISVSQTDRLARFTYTPLGFLYLPEPPSDSLPIPDLRTVQNGESAQVGPDLLEAIRVMQRRETWMRLIHIGIPSRTFVASLQLGADAAELVEFIRMVLALEVDWASRQFTWGSALRHLRLQANSAGILAVINGVVGNNTHRRLDVHGFPGFALPDDYAPLIFVNLALFW